MSMLAERLEALDKAVYVATSVEGLTISIGRDGVWLNFYDGKCHGSINMSDYAKDSRNSIVGSAVSGWCIRVVGKYVPGKEKKP